MGQRDAEWTDDYSDDADGDDDELADEALGREPCMAAGCRRRGSVILFRGAGDDTTLARYCAEHFGQLFTLRGGELRPRPGVELGAIVAPPPGNTPN